jgi:hypothetical protein
MLSTIFTRFGWTRDDVKWTVGVVGGVVVSLAALGSSLTDYGIPGTWLPYLRLGALLVGFVSAKMSTSGLSGQSHA